MKWLSDILFGSLPKRSIKISGWLQILDLCLNTYSYLAQVERVVLCLTTLWQYPLWQASQKFAAFFTRLKHHNFYLAIHRINNSVNIFNKPQIKTTKH